MDLESLLVYCPEILYKYLMSQFIWLFIPNRLIFELWLVIIQYLTLSLNPSSLITRKTISEEPLISKIRILKSWSRNWNKLKSCIRGLKISIWHRRGKWKIKYLSWVVRFIVYLGNLKRREILPIGPKWSCKVPLRRNIKWEKMR